VVTSLAGLSALLERAATLTSSNRKPRSK
jgi:hypothetical protein